MTVAEVPDPQMQALIAALGGTKAALDQVRDELAVEKKRGKTMRRVVWGMVATLVIDAALTVPLVLAFNWASSADDKASRAHDQQVSTCISTNAARENNRQLWDELFKLSAGPRTEAQELQLTKFKAVVAKTFAPRDCSKI